MGVRACCRRRQARDAVAVEVEVAVEVKAKAASQGLAIADGELHAPVAERRTVRPAVSTLAHHCNESRVDEHVVNVLDVGVHRAVQAAVEHGIVETYIILCGGLPLQVVVGRLRGAIA